ncbi:unnamed protein product [Prorocentrum cordatum]|uniref:Uncharacterized protein n=1 Tax=Prorocentrum cordatum TaxID=2364126 RepID=A0ABN9Y0B0_9DINO|nr:unnamed protein product [Polarella glacialis]
MKMVSRTMRWRFVAKPVVCPLSGHACRLWPRGRSWAMSYALSAVRDNRTEKELLQSIKGSLAEADEISTRTLGKLNEQDLRSSWRG